MGQQVCAPWTTPDKLCGTGSGSDTDCGGTVTPHVFKWTPTEVILAASNILYARTCFMYPGVCEYAVWPCIGGGCDTAPHPCVPCYNQSVIVLPGDLEIVSITEITEDGVALDSSAYRLERGRVIRIDGERWQRNTFGLPGVSGVETVVTFQAGTAPPLELQMAAADLADEMLKACNGGECALDPKVRSYVSRGVAVELNDIVKLLQVGMTGIQSVDRAIEVHGRCGGATMLDTAAPYLGTRKV